MDIIDVNCMYGHWPFRRVPGESMPEMVASAAAHGVKTMLMASLNAVFYQDSYEGDRELCAALPDSAYQIMTVNPSLPTYRDDLKRGAAEFRLKGVKIYPTYHGYELTDTCVAELMEILGRMKLPLFVSLIIEDERMCHMLTPQTTPAYMLQSMIQNNEKIPVVFLNAAPMYFYGLADMVNTYGNVYFDTSGMKMPIGAVVRLAGLMRPTNLLYGSHSPMYYRQSTINMVAGDAVPEDLQKKVFYENAKRLFTL